MIDLGPIGHTLTNDEYFELPPDHVFEEPASQVGIGTRASRGRRSRRIVLVHKFCLGTQSRKLRFPSQGRAKPSFALYVPKRRMLITRVRL